MPDISRHMRVLRKFVAGLEGAPVDWALTGSLGMVLQGVPLPEVHDIDVQTDEAGAYAIAGRFAEYVVQPVAPVHTEKMQSHWGKLEIDGLVVEIMGDIEKPGPDGKFRGLPINEIRRWVEVEGMRVPVLDLHYEEQAYRQLGRTARADILRKYLT